MGFCGVFWRLHLTARSRETHGYTQGCKGWQKRRASESIVGERIGTGERKRRWPEWWEALFSFFFFFLKGQLPCLFWLRQTRRGPGTHFVQSIRNGLVAEGDPLRPLCFTTGGGSGGCGTQRNTCCPRCLRCSSDWSNEHAAICQHHSSCIQAVSSNASPQLIAVTYRDAASVFEIRPIRF